jgi:hypothetical protein
MSTSSMAEKSKPAASVVQVEEVDDDDEDDDDEVTAVDGAGLTAVDCAGFSNMSTSSMAEKSKPTTSVVQGEEVDDEDDDDEGTAVDGAGLLPNKGTAVDGAGFSNMSTSLMAEKSKPAASVVQVEEVDDEDDDDKGTAVDGAGLLPNKGTAVDGASFSNKFVYGLSRVDIQAQQRQERMSIRRKKTNNYRLALQHQQQQRQRQQFCQEQNREQHREARAEMTQEQLENRREQDRERYHQARVEMTQEQLENCQEQDRERYHQARAAEGVQITEEVNDLGETFSIDMIGRPTAKQLEGFEFDQDKALLLWYENSHDHVADLIQRLEDCEMGQGWRWLPRSKRCVCHGGYIACSIACMSRRS